MLLVAIIAYIARFCISSPVSHGSEISPLSKSDHSETRRTIYPNSTESPGKDRKEDVLSIPP